MPPVGERPSYEPEFGSQQWLRFGIWARAARPNFSYASNDEVGLFREWLGRHPEKRLVRGGFVHVTSPHDEYVGVLAYPVGSGHWLVNEPLFNTFRSHHQDLLAACSLAEAGELLLRHPREGFPSP